MLEFSVFSVTKLAVCRAYTAKLYKGEGNHYNFEVNTKVSDVTI